VPVTTTDRTAHIGAKTFSLLREEAERRNQDVDATAEDLLAERLSGPRIDGAKMERTLERAA